MSDKETRESYPMTQINTDLDDGCEGQHVHDTRMPSIKGYQILDLLGEGGMGIVWRAIQLSTGREVALKVMGSLAMGSEKRMRRFEREIRLAAKLEHPSIARIYDASINQGICCYSMQLVHGQHLDTYVRKQGLTKRQIIQIMLKITDGVAFAHDHQVLHRDLKPSNIIVTDDGMPYLLDFGLAKSVDTSINESTLSMEGMISGTPGFMSPEQAAGRISLISPATDVYSLGVIAYNLLTDRLPHCLEGTQYEILRRIAEDEVLPASRFNPDIDSKLDTIMCKAMQREPSKRYPTAREMADDLKRYLDNERIAAKPMRNVSKKRKRTIAYIVITIILFLILVKIGDNRKKNKQLQAEKAKAVAAAQAAPDPEPARKTEPAKPAQPPTQNQPPQYAKIDDGPQNKLYPRKPETKPGMHPFDREPDMPPHGGAQPASTMTEEQIQSAIKDIIVPFFRKHIAGYTEKNPLKVGNTPPFDNLREFDVWMQDDVFVIRDPKGNKQKKSFKDIDPVMLNRIAATLVADANNMEGYKVLQLIRQVNEQSPIRKKIIDRIKRGDVSGKRRPFRRF